jgi:hypothetical protein
MDTLETYQLHIKITKLHIRHKWCCGGMVEVLVGGGEVLSLTPHKVSFFTKIFGRAGWLEWVRAGPSCQVRTGPTCQVMVGPTCQLEAVPTWQVVVRPMCKWVGVGGTRV